MNSTSQSPLTAGEAVPRIVALDGVPRRYVIEATLDVAEETDAVQLVQLYWAVEGMQPVVVDIDDDHLHARFRQHAPSAEVAAWTLADDLRALPGARLTMVAVRAANEPEPELVLTRAADILAGAAPHEVAA